MPKEEENILHMSSALLKFTKKAKLRQPLIFFLQILIYILPTLIDYIDIWILYLLFCLLDFI